jgi:hypothetical protein
MQENKEKPNFAYAAKEAVSEIASLPGQDVNVDIPFVIFSDSLSNAERTVKTWIDYSFEGAPRDVRTSKRQVKERLFSFEQFETLLVLTTYDSPLLARLEITDEELRDTLYRNAEILVARYVDSLGAKVSGARKPKFKISISSHQEIIVKFARFQQKLLQIVGHDPNSSRRR